MIKLGIREMLKLFLTILRPSRINKCLSMMAEVIVVKSLRTLCKGNIHAALKTKLVFHKDAVNL